MDSYVKVAFCLLVCCVALISEVLCSTSNNQARLPPNSNANAWPPLGAQNTHHVNPTWSNFGTTTPWPELGSRRSHSGNNNQNGPTWVQNGPTWVRTTNQQPPNFQNVPPPSGTGNIGISNLPSSGTGTGGVRRQNQDPNDVNDDDLRDFSENLLQRDTNNAARFVTINYQGKTTSRSQNDEAPQPLLSIHPDAYSIPTIAKLMLLHNNYVLETNANEHVSAQERDEENNLLDVLLGTSVMQLTKNFLIEHGKIGRDPREFRDILKEIWFSMYARGGGRIGSSGFEHVFLAELKNTTVSGLHNWIYFKEEEAKNKANYLGYLKKVELGDKGAILKYHFKFYNQDKPVGSMFIGTSPELEIALYTTCFLLRADRVCPLKLAGNKFIIRTYTYRYRGKKLIGSAFPEI